MKNEELKETVIALHFAKQPSILNSSFLILHLCYSSPIKG